MSNINNIFIEFINKLKNNEHDILIKEYTILDLNIDLINKSVCSKLLIAKQLKSILLPEIENLLNYSTTELSKDINMIKKEFPNWKLLKDELVWILFIIYFYSIKFKKNNIMKQLSALTIFLLSLKYYSSLTRIHLNFCNKTVADYVFYMLKDTAVFSPKNKMIKEFVYKHLKNELYYNINLINQIIYNPITTGLFYISIKVHERYNIQLSKINNIDINSNKVLITKFIYELRHRISQSYKQYIDKYYKYKDINIGEKESNSSIKSKNDIINIENIIQKALNNSTRYYVLTNQRILKIRSLTGINTNIIKSLFNTFVKEPDTHELYKRIIEILLLASDEAYEILYLTKNDKESKWIKYISKQIAIRKKHELRKLVIQGILTDIDLGKYYNKISIQMKRKLIVAVILIIGLTIFDSLNW